MLLYRCKNTTIKLEKINTRLYRVTYMFGTHKAVNEYTSIEDAKLSFKTFKLVATMNEEVPF